MNFALILKSDLIQLPNFNDLYISKRLNLIIRFWLSLCRITENATTATTSDFQLLLVAKDDNGSNKRPRHDYDTDLVSCFEWNHLCFIAAIQKENCLNSNIDQKVVLPNIDAGTSDEAIMLEVEVMGLLFPSANISHENTSCENEVPRRRMCISVPTTFGLSSRPRIIQVAVGYYHVLVLVGWENTQSNESDDITQSSTESVKYCVTRVYATGYGTNGELGVGYRLDWSEEFVPIDFTEHVKFIAAGDCCSALITAHQGRVYTFGSGAYFRLGHEDDLDRLSPCFVSALQHVGQLQPNGEFSGMKSVACGRFHMAAVSVGLGDVYCWGWNRFGQLGHIGKIKEGKTRGSHVCEPRRMSELDAPHLLGHDSSGGTHVCSIRQILCGARFTALLTTSNKVIIM